jgi:hypothetical protein
MMLTKQYWRLLGLLLALAGCRNTSVDVSNFTRGPAPLRDAGPTQTGQGCSYEESVEGHRLFAVYCAACHNARPLAERPFANYQNVMQHMRVRANLTGQESAKLMAWLRRWHDVPSPDQREGGTAKRFIFGQPIPELREQMPPFAADPVAGPRMGATDESSTGQPPPGNGPREGR